MNAHTARPTLPPQARAMELVQTAVAGKLIATLTEAGVPDALADGPCTVGEIARKTQLNAQALARALRAAELLGVFVRTEDGAWRNTEVAAALRTNAPGSVRDYVVYALHDGNWRAWQHLADSLRTGEPSFSAANDGLSFWEYFDAHEDVAESFHRGMAAMATVGARALPGALGLDRFSTVADIGGGSGIVLAELLKAEPRLKGILYDRAEAVAAARERFFKAGLLDHVALVSGDIFDQVPGGADAYVLKNILHDHDEAKCARILEVLHAGMPDNTTLFVIEAVLPEGPAPHPAIWRDLHMMVALGGCERTETEWHALLNAHDFTIERITSLPGPDAVIEVRKTAAK